jgi:hypothetical protein
LTGDKTFLFQIGKPIYYNMKRILIFLTVLALSFSIKSPVAAKTKLCTPNPSKEAVALYRYLLDMNGEKILSGQMWVPWSDDGFVYIQENTGKQPAIMGIDFINEGENKRGVQKALDWSTKSGGIVTAMWHQGAPSLGEGYEASKLTIDINQCFIEGTPEYVAFWAGLKKKADYLQQFRDANVPVLWRPFHELNGGWFWWSKQGPEAFKKLWIAMYDYFVNERKLNNLIWVLCYSREADGSWNPGSEYVDIQGTDTYNDGASAQLKLFNTVKNIVGNDTIPIAYHECGTPPNPDQCLIEGAMWSWWMEWHTGHLFALNIDTLNIVYHHDLVITLDELPNINSVYGWDSTCTPTAITPSIKYDDGEWIQTSKAGKFSGASSVTFRPDVNESGTWSWSGTGVSGSADEQTIAINDYCTITATFLNQCGATSTQTFNVYNDCTPTVIKPHIQINGVVWKDTSKVTISPGSTILLSPEAGEGGAWVWSGSGVSDTTRELLVTPSGSGSYTVTRTNFCGKTSKLSFKITVDKNSGVSGLSESDIVSLYPVPCTESLNVKMQQFRKDLRSTLTIYNIDGSVIDEIVAETAEIVVNTSKLEKGIYFVKIRKSNSEVYRKFLKR